MAWREWLLGKPLRAEDQEGENLSPVTGIPVLGLDALASAAYGPEAALTVLLPIGLAGTRYIGPITAIIAVLLFAVFFSYRQTIAAYPNGGGSFTVAKENLGRIPGLLAASALGIDYVLNVSVAIAAGVGALVSAVPSLLPMTVPFCLGILGLLMLVNLRGIRTTGMVFMLPTYLFVGCLIVTVGFGLTKTILAHGHPSPELALSQHGATGADPTAWLLLRAFAAGCTALTGIEAVSNAVPVFRKPTVQNARRTLTYIFAILGVLLAGIAFLSHTYGVTATPPGRAGYETLLSRIISVIFGRGVFYFISMGVILAVLALSANTSFTDFPRVCRLLALDEFLPAGFAHRGRRLVYSRGIVVLVILSGALLLVFGGITDRLIPLFAVGAFTAFTLSQAGMVVHWYRCRDAHARRYLAMNAIGLAATATTLVIISVAKFKEGAWIALLTLLPLVLLLRGIRRHHEKLETEVVDAGPLEIPDLREPIVVIPLRRLDRVARNALTLALSLSSEIRAVQVRAEEMKTQDLEQCWANWVEKPARQANCSPPVLVVLRSPYREVYGPLLDYLDKLAAQHPDRHIAVMVPELVERRWYQFLVPHRATFLKSLLLLKSRPQISILDSPWYPKDSE